MDLVIDRILHPQGMGDNTPCAPSIQDASKWSEDQKREFMQFQQDIVQFRADRVRLTKFREVMDESEDGELDNDRWKLTDATLDGTLALCLDRKIGFDDKHDSREEA